MSFRHTNVVLFFPTSFNSEFTEIDSLSDDDLLNFVSGACFNISTEISNYLGDDVEVYAAHWNDYDIVNMVSLLDIEAHEGKSYFIENDVWESVALVVRHNDSDWSQSFLKISETTDNSFWVIGRTGSNDVISNEFDGGDYSDGYEVEGDGYLNMERNVQQIKAAENLVSKL